MKVTLHREYIYFCYRYGELVARRDSIYEARKVRCTRIEVALTTNTPGVYKWMGSQVRTGEKWSSDSR